jgi:hypothetical protein
MVRRKGGLSERQQNQDGKILFGRPHRRMGAISCFFDESVKTASSGEGARYRRSLCLRRTAWPCHDTGSRPDPDAHEPFRDSYLAPCYLARSRLAGDAALSTTSPSPLSFYEF